MFKNQERKPNKSQSVKHVLEIGTGLGIGIVAGFVVGQEAKKYIKRRIGGYSNNESHQKDKPSVVDKAASKIEPVLHRQLGEFGLNQLSPISLESVAEEKKKTGGSLDLYLHFPFCAEVCSFCAFHRQVGSESQRENYVQSFQETIQQALPQFGKDQKVRSIYMGGGTPGMLTLDQAGRILSTIRENIDASKAAITFELHPENITREYIEGLQVLGINRFSVGVQNLSEAERGVLRRTITSGEEDIQKLQILNEMGVQYNIDLMFGTPNQTPESWRETFTRIIDEVHPPEITMYQYVNAHGAETPKLIAKGVLDRPGVKTRHDMYREAQEHFMLQGYKQTSTLSFSRDQSLPERELLSHNSDFLGLGPKTYSKIGRYMFINDARTHQFKLGQVDKTQKYYGINFSSASEWVLEKTFSLFARQRSDGHPTKLPAVLDAWKSEAIAQTYGILYYMTNQPTFDRRRLRMASTGKKSHH